MQKLKGGMRESKLFDMRIYPVIQLATKATYIHVVEALTKSITSRPPSLLREHNHGHIGPGFH